MKVLHVAPLNVAGVPFSMVDMQRRFGADARLVTLHANTFSFPEDICLNLPLPRGQAAKFWRASKIAATQRLALDGSRTGQPPSYAPRNIFESFYFRWDDRRRKMTIFDALQEYGLNDYEIIHYDGGLDFFRDARLARKWKKEGKKIICHYMGSDLRVRGVHPVVDQLSDLNLTNESDHLHLHPKLEYIYIPFDVSPFEPRNQENERLRLVHSPTNRAMKGTELIIPVVDAVKKVRNIEFVLIENKTHEEVIRIKQTCDLAIEQVGNLGGTGYGRNSLETLALGIPTITEMTSDYLAWLPENPFILATPQTLYDQLIHLIDHPELRSRIAEQGRKWVETYHSYGSVHKRLMDLYREYHIV